MLGSVIIGINIYFLCSKFVGWILDNSLPISANILSIIVFPLMLLYICAVIYLTLRKETIQFVSCGELQTIETDKSKAANDSNNEEKEHVSYNGV